MCGCCEHGKWHENLIIIFIECDLKMWLLLLDFGLVMNKKQMLNLIWWFLDVFFMMVGHNATSDGCQNKRIITFEFDLQCNNV